MKSITARVLLVIIGLAAALLPAEWYLRAHAGTASKWIEDPATGLLILRPKTTLISENTCLRAEARSNAQGFNDRDHERSKPSNTFRIAILGDSFTEGLHVPPAHRFSALLEEKLNALPGRHPRYEVLNFGITTHGTLENILYFDSYARAYEPDLVIDAFLADNDVLDDTHATRPIPVLDDTGRVVTTGRTFRARVRSLARRSRFVVLLWNRVQMIRQARSLSKENSGTDDILFERGVYLKSPPPFWEQAWSHENEILKTLNTAVTRSGSTLLLVSLAEGFRTHPQLLAELPEAYRDSKRFDYNAPEQRLASTTAREGIAYLSLLPRFRTRAAADPKARVSFPCDGHWNETGHRWAAEEITAYIAAHITTTE